MVGALIGKKSTIGCAGPEDFREDSQEMQLLAVLLFCTKQDAHFWKSEAAVAAFDHKLSPGAVFYFMSVR